MTTSDKVFFKYPCEDRNWQGLPSHETDRIVSWRESQPEVLMLKLRESYDKIIALGLEEELELLVSTAMRQARQEIYDEYAGESI